MSDDELKAERIITTLDRMARECGPHEYGLPVGSLKEMPRMVAAVVGVLAPADDGEAAAEAFLRLPPARRAALLAAAGVHGGGG